MSLFCLRELQRALPGLGILIAGGGVEEHDRVLRLNPRGGCEFARGDHGGRAFRRGENSFERGQFPSCLKHFVVSYGDRSSARLAEHAQNQMITERARNAQTRGDGRGVRKKLSRVLVSFPSFDDRSATLRL